MIDFLKLDENGNLDIEQLELRVARPMAALAEVLKDTPRSVDERSIVEVLIERAEEFECKLKELIGLKFGKGGGHDNRN